MIDERLRSALKWCKKKKIEQLNLFNREYQIELKSTSKQRKFNKKSSEKDKEICQGIRAGEFKQMCKKAGVEPGSLAKTVFTESIKDDQ